MAYRTPGDWAVTITSKPQIVACDGRVQIATVFTSVEDANLLAAAPQMRTALREVLRFIDDTGILVTADYKADELIARIRGIVARTDD